MLALAIVFWLVAIVHAGCVRAFIVQAAASIEFGTSAWTVPAVYALCLCLHVSLPARRVRGYVCDERNEPIEYRLNGVLILVAVLAAFWCLPELMQASCTLNCSAAP